MDGLRFDVWTRRRVGMAAGTLLAGLGGFVPLLGEAKKKKKKCKKPKVKCKKKCCAAGQVCSGGKCTTPPPAEECQFTKTATLWTLQEDCAITRLIRVPDGVTVDGDGKTISLQGSTIEGDVMLANAQGASTFHVRNLTLDGSGCSGYFLTALAFDGVEGTVDEVTITNVACGSWEGTAIHLVDAAAVEISNSTIENVDLGVRVQANCSCTTHDNTLTNCQTGFSVHGDAATLQATNNTIVGPGSIAQPAFGIQFSFQGGGEVDGNTISNYFSTDFVACGISIDAEAGAVTLGENTFPDPPGNEQDVCDFT